MQSTSLTVREPQAIAVNYSQEQTDLIKKTYAKGATDLELQLFLEVAKRKGLDIFSRQIHFVKRKGKNGVDTADIQTGIDGYRLIAERTGQYDGQEGPYWCGEDGDWRDVWVACQPPIAAKVIVYRKDSTRPFSAVARFAEYAQRNWEGQPVAMWAKMPANQLAKCAEALALRKAFPAELSGIYTQEEMAQAGEVIDIEAEPVTEKPIAKTPRAALKAVPKAAPVTEVEAEPVVATVQVMPQSTEGDHDRNAFLQGEEAGLLPEFNQPETEETPEEIEAERQSLIATLKAACYECGATDATWQQFEIQHDIYNKSENWLQINIEAMEARAAKIREATAPVVLTDTQAKSLPGQLDGRKKMQRQGPDGKSVAVLEHEGSHMKGRVATHEESIQNLNYWIDYWRTHATMGQDLATIRAKVARVVGQFHDWSDLNGADLAKAIRVLQEWRPDLDKQTALKGAKK